MFVDGIGRMASGECLTSATSVGLSTAEGFIQLRDHLGNKGSVDITTEDHQIYRISRDTSWFSDDQTLTVSRYFGNNDFRPLFRVSKNTSWFSNEIGYVSEYADPITFDWSALDLSSRVYASYSHGVGPYVVDGLSLLLNMRSRTVCEHDFFDCLP